jgi:hypothetical protein
MEGFHAGWMWVAVVSNGIVGAYGVAMAALKRVPGRSFLVARAIAITAMLVQIGAGLVLWGRGQRPGNGFHVFYGVVIAVTLSIAYVYRPAMARKPALTYGLLLLFVMGLGLRAWANVN